MKICKVENCENKIRAKNLCNKHYLRSYRHGDPLFTERERSITGICKIEGCENKYYGLGYCSKHYARFKKYGDPLFTKNEKNITGICKIEGCDNKYYCKNLCKKHYSKLWEYGDPLFTKNEKHGLTNTFGYRTWLHMIHRCTNPKVSNFKNYGGRGIQVCDRWNIPGDKKQSVLNFISDMGPRKSDESSIDRKNNNGNYEPGNCRWSSKKTQNRNTRDTILNQEIVAEIRKLFTEGKTKLEISKKLDIKYQLIYDVLRKNEDGSWKCWELVRKIKEKI